MRISWRRVNCRTGACRLIQPLTKNYYMRKSICVVLVLILCTPLVFSQKDNSLTSKEKKKGWVLLFDGKTTNGWTTPGGKPVSQAWEIKDGSLSVKKESKAGDIITVGEYSNFELSVDYKIEPGCNSGIKYFYTRYTNGGNLGMEYQIIDDQLGEDNKKDNHLCGSFYDVIPPVEAQKKVNAPGQWNTIRIVAKDKKVEHWLNGKKILEFTRGSKEYMDAVALSKFSKTVPAFGMVEKGHILLQEHGGAVAFKNIKIITL